MNHRLINLLAILVLAVAGAFVFAPPVFADGEEPVCTTPSGGECTGEDCCTIDDACFAKCPIEQ